MKASQIKNGFAQIKRIKISMKDMKIGSKLLVYILAVVIMTSIITGMGMVGLYKAKTSMNELYEKNTMSIREMSSILTNLYSIQLAVKKAVFYSSNHGVILQSEESYKSNLAEYNTHEANFSALTKGSGYDQKLETARNALQVNYLPTVEAVFEYLKNGDAIQAKASETMITETIMAIMDAYNTAMDYAVTTAEETNEKNNALVARITWLLLITSAVGIAAIFALGLLIKKYTDKPTRDMASAAQSLANGRLDIDISYESKDEIGQLAKALNSAAETLRGYIGNISEHLNTMAEGDMSLAITKEYIGDFLPIKNSIQKISESFNVLLAQIKQTAEQVNNGAEQVSSGAQALAQGATEQAGAIEQLSLSIGEVYAKVKDNSENVSRVTEDMEITISEVGVANEKMQQLHLAMEGIGSSSEKISKIIKVIDDIAFQTNILALNAAVEAARAGESGRGFAVVADEVRNLAGRSAEAAKETAELIQDSIKRVQEGFKLSDATGRATSEVAIKMKSVNESIKEIDKASFEQANAIDQITQGIEQISAVVQTNSATAEQSAAASEELSGQAQAMKELVGRFKLSKKSSDNQYVPSNMSEYKTNKILLDSKY